MSFIGFVFVCAVSTIGPCTRANAQKVIQIPGPGFTNTLSVGFAGAPCIRAAVKYAQTLTIAGKIGVNCEIQGK